MKISVLIPTVPVEQVDSTLTRQIRLSVLPIFLLVLSYSARMSVPSTRTVSYTHLDVYKRQSGIMAKHPKILKIISAAMLCFCALALGKERQKGKTTMTGIGYALLLGGGISNFIDRMKKGSVTDLSLIHI